MATSSPRQFLQIRLRTLMAAVSVVAVLLGLWVSWVAPSRRQAEAVRIVKGLGGQVTYGDARIGVPLPTGFLRDYLVPVVAVGLGDTHVAAADLQMLQRLPHLKSLSLKHTNVTDEMLPALAELRPLEKLNLADNDLHGRALSHLKHLPKLRHLDLSRTTAMSHFKEVAHDDPRLPGLRDNENQTVWESQPLAVAIADLREMRCLESLNLSETQVNDADLKEIAGLTNLQVLQLANTEVSDTGIRELGSLPNLVEIDLGETRVVGRGLGPLQRLRRLSLRGCTEVCDATLSDVGQLANLEDLDLSFTGYRHETGEAVQPQLHSLDGSRLERVLFRALGYQEPGPSVITDAGLRKLHSLHRLRSVHLHATDVTDSGKNEFQQALPNLVIFQ